MRPHQLAVVQHCNHRPTLRMPCVDELQQCEDRGLIDAREWFVEQYHRRVLSQQACKAHALKLSSGQLADPV